MVQLEPFFPACSDDLFRIPTGQHVLLEFLQICDIPSLNKLNAENLTWSVEDLRSGLFRLSLGMPREQCFY